MAQNDFIFLLVVGVWIVAYILFYILFLYTPKESKKSQKSLILAQTQIHKDICIKFEVGGRQYEAVGFLHEGEQNVTTSNMLLRAFADTHGGTHGMMSDEEQEFFARNLDKFSCPIELHCYHLVAGWEAYDYRIYISFYRWGGRGWYQLLGKNNYRWGARDLVVRRVVQMCHNVSGK